VPLPLLEYQPTSQNQRVAGYLIGNEEQPMMYSAVSLPAGSDMEGLIWAAYRQIFSEHQLLKFNRQTILESQLRFGQIRVRDFIRGLLVSEPFRLWNYEPNDNYRFVELCVQRVLGRDVYSEREKIAWSIVLGTKGIEGFADALLDSDEYMESFGWDTVPYQKRRVLPQKATGETPFNLKTPRYGPYHRSQLGFPQMLWQNAVRRFIPQEQKPAAGNPVNFLAMARGLNSAKGVIPPKVSAMSINIGASVPRR